MAIAGVFGDLIGVRGVFLGGAAVVLLAAIASFVLFHRQHAPQSLTAAADEAVAA